MLRESIYFKNKRLDKFNNQNLIEYNPLPQYFLMKILLYSWKRYTDITFHKLLEQEFDRKVYFESDTDSLEEKLTNYGKTLQIKHVGSFSKL